MKRFFLLSITIIIFFSACTKENSLTPQLGSQEYSMAQWMNDAKIARSEIHIAILSSKGEESFGAKKYTFHLSADYANPLVMDSDTLVRQLWHVNDVCNHGATQDKPHYPYANYLFNNYNGNKIAEIPISVKLVADTAAAKVWLLQVCDNGYAPHTKLMYHTPNDYVKIIYPNL
jgi:hypothetical protein